MKSRTATLVETVRRTPIFNHLVPQEAGVGWPLPVRPGGRGGALYVTLPFFGITPDPAGGPTKLYPPFSTLTLKWSNGLPVEYLDLRFRNPWPGDWEGLAGVFPHAAVAGMSVREYEAAKVELFRLYDEMFDRLDRGDSIPGEFAGGFGKLLRLLLEPPLEPFYRVLAPKFFDRFRPADKHARSQT